MGENRLDALADQTLQLMKNQRSETGEVDEDAISKQS
jgi:hypothetical protein